MRKLKGLEDAVSLNVVDWVLTPEGWKFNAEVSGDLFYSYQSPIKGILWHPKGILAFPKVLSKRVFEYAKLFCCNVHNLVNIII